MRWITGAATAIFVVAACGGKIDVAGDAGDGSPGDGPSSAGMCCAPDPSPGCCMHYGGWTDGTSACPEACDGMPVPSAPGWHLAKDAHGCSVWVAPSSGPICGAPLPVDASVGCAPADVSAFQPAPIKPYFDHSGVCTAQQIGDFYTQCFSSSATGQSCQTFQSQNTACAACVITARSAPQWGAMISDAANGIFELDEPGCLALVTGDSSPTSCAQKLDDVQQCESAACDASCPVSDPQSFNAYENCVAAADAGGCSKFVSAECVSDGGATAVCIPGAFQTGFQTYAAMFCGN